MMKGSIEVVKGVLMFIVMGARNSVKNITRTIYITWQKLRDMDRFLSNDGRRNHQTQAFNTNKISRK